MGVLHKDRIFGLKPNSCEIDITSIISYNSMPDVYSSVNGYIMVGEDDRGDVLSIAALDNGVLCFKAGATYFINTSLGNDITQWSVNKIDPKRGVCSPYSVANTPRGVIGLSIDKENEVDLRLLLLLVQALLA